MGENSAMQFVAGGEASMQSCIYVTECMNLQFMGVT